MFLLITPSLSLGTTFLTAVSLSGPVLAFQLAWISVHNTALHCAGLPSEGGWKSRKTNKKKEQRLNSPHIQLTEADPKPLWDLPVPELYVEFISFWMHKVLLWLWGSFFSWGHFSWMKGPVPGKRQQWVSGLQGTRKQRPQRMKLTVCRWVSSPLHACSSLPNYATQARRYGADSNFCLRRYHPMCVSLVRYGCCCLGSRCREK